MTRRLACFAGTWLLAGSAQAQAIKESAPSIQSAAQAEPAVLSEGELGASRAGQASVTGTQTLNATTTGNTVTGDLVAGSITLSGNALAKFSGLGNFAINSGSQVSIQSAMNLTVSVTN